MIAQRISRPGAAAPTSLAAPSALITPTAPTGLTALASRVAPTARAALASRVAFAALAALGATLVAPGGARAATEVVAVRRGAVSLDPNAADWRDVPAFAASLLPQDVVEPRLVEPSTPEVRVKAVNDGKRIAFRLEWGDATRSDTPGVARFSDACAVQLPVGGGPDVPSPQMGEAGRPVEMSYWRAFWQSAVDGRPDTIQALYPNAAVDHYPFEAAPLERDAADREAMARRYAPARALGNDMAGPRERPVQDLIAEGPGTIAPAKTAQSDGRGVRGEGSWAVVLSRPLPQGVEPGARGEVAFAVWDGGGDEAGARKMRTGWVPLLVERAP